MIADVILGFNIDTIVWIEELKEHGMENIIVVDYEWFEEPINREGILFLSSIDAKSYIKKFDTVNYYKSMYVYPGMSGKMSSLIKKKEL
ncbi:hypothetical protein G159_19410 [Planococcus glaciei CHR43]|uniref:hypothetical protein n=1 Tax=Planococcus glaciei TaxID=459472 RepID=UPI0003DF184E|nr:hypothetical protein [Planococcus glaciei]ETP67315.1 hypothetical protein G159_19410 [Planococcus glaciei CHR43]